MNNSKYILEFEQPLKDIEDRIENWIGDGEQIDDVLVIGIGV